MAGFCTRCGNTLPADVAFCDACGQAVAGKQAPSPTVTASTTAKRTPSRMLLGGVTTLLLLLIGGAALFLMQGSEPPTGSSLARLLNSDKAFLQDKTCLDNFDYAANPTYVSAYDEHTQQWLQILVDAGLYKEPQRVVTRNGFFNQERLRYEQAEAAKDAVQNGKLCFASGLTITSVQYAPLQQRNDMHLARGELTYQYEKPAPWISTPDAVAMQPDRFSKDSYTAVIYLGKQGSEDWKLLAPGEGIRLERQMAASITTQAESGSAWKLSDFFSGLFHGNPAGAVMGKWSIEQGSQVVHIEFMPDAMVTEGKKTAVSYVVNGKHVTIRAGTPAEDALALVIVSDDEIGIDIGFGKLPLYRVR